jgi:hypothetical protein
MSEPVGPQYGLDPLRDHTLVTPPVTSRDLTNPLSYKDGSEFGGVAGMVQPAPHNPNAHERLWQVYAIDPTDSGIEAGSVLPPELDGNFDPR